MLVKLGNAWFNPNSIFKVVGDHRPGCTVYSVTGETHYIHEMDRDSVARKLISAKADPASYFASFANEEIDKLQAELITLRRQMSVLAEEHQKAIDANILHCAELSGRNTAGMLADKKK